MDLHAGVYPVILERTNHFEASAVPNVCQAGVAMTAEVSLKNPAILRTVKKCAPCLQFAHTIRRLPGMQFGHTEIVEVLAATHCVGEMNLPVVTVIDVGESRGDSAFSHHRVGFAEQRLADETHRCSAVR